MASGWVERIVEQLPKLSPASFHLQVTFNSTCEKKKSRLHVEGGYGFHDGVSVFVFPVCPLPFCPSN